MNEDLLSRIDYHFLTPYKELGTGYAESIFDHLQPGYTVPDKVIAYLRADLHYMICMTPCNHPFKPGVKLDNLFYEDDYGYCWDGHTWKYVLKYGLTLPEEFITHVMSEEGTAYINQCIDQNPDWSDAMKKWKKEHQGYLCLMPTREEMKKLEYF